MKSLNCPNCGAAISAQLAKLDVVTCEFCNTSFRIPKTNTPEADMGDLILGADFSSNIMPGWEFLNQDKLKFHKGNPNEVRAVFSTLPNKIHYVLKSSGLLDDFDASVTMRFTEGDEKMLRAGAYLRFSDLGGYTFLVSAISTYQVGVFTKDKDGNLVWKAIINWTLHTALRAGLNQNNRLRVICDGDQFRLYLNGVLATSFKDSTISVGPFYLAVDPYSTVDAVFAFSDLQVREVK